MHNKTQQTTPRTDIFSNEKISKARLELVSRCIPYRQSALPTKLNTYFIFYIYTMLTGFKIIFLVQKSNHCIEKRSIL